MNDNRSVATIDQPEFIDVKPFNPLISECVIKVMYIGKNRNGSYIDKNTAIQMANSLPGCPIVGVYREEIQDFGDHGHVITIENGEVKFSCKTVPYGFVAPDARVWFQKFNDTDEFGNDTEHEYMMTTGYLWTGQFEEARSVIDDGKGQSMELDDDTLDGHWATDSNSGMDFFIINDAMFSKLCILGDDVEPCFEGASIVSADSKFSENKEFARTLYSMIRELQDAIGNKEGGLNMPEDFTVTSNGNVVETVEEAVEVDAPQDVEEVEEIQSEPEEEAPVEEPIVADDSGEFVREEDEDEDPEQQTEEADEEDDEKKKDIVDSKKKRCSAEDNEDKLASIEAELEELRAFKRAVENKEKDALINKYHMLSDEDKADIIAHKEEYSLEQIDEKLALIYVKNNVDFSTVDGHPASEEIEQSNEGILTFSLSDADNNGEAVDEVQMALREIRNNY